MKLSIAVAALLAALFVGYYVNAEQDAPPAQPPTPVTVWSAPAYSAPYVPHTSAPIAVPGAVYPQPMPHSLRSVGPIEAGLVEAAREFGKSLDSAVQDRLITEECANACMSEWGLSLAVKKARLDLLRVIATIDYLEQDNKGFPGWDEVRDLRKLLPKREAIELKSELSAKRQRPALIGDVRLDEPTKQ
jgi:hypothetical protein